MVILKCEWCGFETQSALLMVSHLDEHIARTTVVQIDEKSVSYPKEKAKLKKPEAKSSAEKKYLENCKKRKSRLQPAIKSGGENCSVAGCGVKASCRGLCDRHYKKDYYVRKKNSAVKSDGP